MTVYSISYDLNDPGQDYDELHSAIEALGPAFHALGSTWLVDVSGESAGDIRKELDKHVDSNDSILVTQVQSTGSGRWSYTSISGGLGDWFDDHL